MDSLGISLGWDCGPARYGVSNNLRNTKKLQVFRF